MSGPVGHGRLSDYIRASAPFWYVLTGGGTLIVNCTHIVAALVEKGDQ